MIPNYKLAELFSKGEQSGLGSNMFIEDNTIYSYGHHFKIAQRLNPDQEIATGYRYVYNFEYYSASTARHQKQVRDNLNRYIEIPGCDIEEAFLRKYAQQLASELEEIKTKQSKLKTKGVRFQQYQAKIEETHARYNEVYSFLSNLYGGQAIQFIKEEN